MILPHIFMYFSSYWLFISVVTSITTSTARNSLLSADVPLRNYSLTHSLTELGSGPDVTRACDSESGVNVVITDRLSHSSASQVSQASLIIFIAIISYSSSGSSGWSQCQTDCRHTTTCQLPQPQRLHSSHGTSYVWHFFVGCERRRLSRLHGFINVGANAPEKIGLSVLGEVSIVLHERH